MNLFPNFAAQRAPRFPQRVFQPASIVKRLYRPPELLGAIAPTTYVMTASGAFPMPASVWPMPDGVSYGQWPPIVASTVAQPVTAAPATPVQARRAAAAATTTTVTPSTTVTAADTSTASITDQISAWLTGQMISGVPNYWLAIAAAGAGLLMMRSGGKGRR
jgi:hypothetical protein